MNKEFVPYELALRMKQLGFDEPCMYYVDEQNNSFIYNFQTHPDEFIEWCGVTVISTPLYQQAFRWFREKYDLDYSLLPESSSGHRLLDRTFNIVIYKYYINMNVQSEIVRIDGKIAIYNKREEAELACLRKLIQIIENK
jgi:hypothetical protein